MSIKSPNKRVIIDNVEPEINGGKFRIKRVPGEEVRVTADIFAEGHDQIKADLLFRKKGVRTWNRIRMDFLGNDHWEGKFKVEKTGVYEYTIMAWVDQFTTWQTGLKKKFEANQNIELELKIGAGEMEKAADNLKGEDKKILLGWAQELMNPEDVSMAVTLAESEEVTQLMDKAYDRSSATWYEKVPGVWVDRNRAAFSSWYEFFPRSASTEPGKHGSFKDAKKLIPIIAGMGFNVIYLPPVHPIGKSFRKGKNNNVKAKKGEPGSPWAIGSKEGGHTAIHPELGDMEDFKSFVKESRKHDMEIALDFAIQCSPDHPYVKDHPQWFKWRPDGTVQYAENPPKKYQDVLPINFETNDWENLWEELKSIVEFWIKAGVTIFRVDNPHTKPFDFWEWLIGSIQKEHPEVLFLSEAFTRPRIMERLAKIGFTQSYTYFTWRITKEELSTYMNELTGSAMKEYFRPNFWPNTPDINPYHLQEGGETGFIIRALLAGTLSSNYGIYGPVFHFGINQPVPGKEEYFDSEKYEIKDWDWNKKTRISETLTRLNKIRKMNPALQKTNNIVLCENDNPNVLTFVKTDEEKKNKLIIIISLDPDHTQSGWMKVPYHELNIKKGTSFEVHDLLNVARYSWNNEWNYFELHPKIMPAHIFRIENEILLSDPQAKEAKKIE